MAAIELAVKMCAGAIDAIAAAVADVVVAECPVKINSFLRNMVDIVR